MSIQFHSPCVFVADMVRSRAFYEDCLGQEPSLVLDGYVVYPGFCLWRIDTARKHVFGEPDAVSDGPMGRDNFELYFEAEPLEDAWERVMPRVETIHPMKLQPGGSVLPGARPDGHISGSGPTHGGGHPRLDEAGRANGNCHRHHDGPGLRAARPCWIPETDLKQPKSLSVFQRAKPVGRRRHTDDALAS